MGGAMNFVSAIAQTIAGPEAAGKISQVVGEISNGTISSGNIISKAAQISGYRLGQQGIVSQMAKNADSAAGFAGLLGADIGDDAAATIQNVSKKIAELGKTSEGQKQFIEKINGELSREGNLFNDISDDVIKSFKARMGSAGSVMNNVNATTTDYAKVLGKEKGGGLTAARLGLFADPELGKTRLGMTAGAYGAGAVGLRVLSGGDLTHNARGESDIAGIPFY